MTRELDTDHEALKYIPCRVTGSHCLLFLVSNNTSLDAFMFGGIPRLKFPGERQTWLRFFLFLSYRYLPDGSRLHDMYILFKAVKIGRQADMDIFHTSLKASCPSNK